MAAIQEEAPPEVPRAAKPGGMVESFVAPAKSVAPQAEAPPELPRAAKAGGAEDSGDAPPAKSVAPRVAAASPEPIPKEEGDGCTTWEVVLAKQGGARKYGFTHGNGKRDFLRRRNQPLQLGETMGHDSADEALDDEVGPEQLLVKKVSRDGLLHDWNRAHPDAKVRMGDRIAGVNGAGTIPEMQRELRSEEVRMKVLRQHASFSVALSKREGAQKLGFKFGKRELAGTGLAELKITEVQPGGLLEEANLRHMERGLFHLVAMPGMRIEAANSAEGDAGKIAEELRRATTLQMRLRRPEAVVPHQQKSPASPPGPAGSP